MPCRFNRHYTREEANALLPQIRQWLEQLHRLRSDLEKHDRRLNGLLSPGSDLGGELVNQWVRAIAEAKAVLDEFQQRGILIKDLERGLIDFPAMLGGKEVLLCWEQDEESVDFWHDLDSGYAGREPL